MTLIFVGYLLTSFHFTINGIDLLPDFLGFILIAAGLWQMADKSNHFERSIPWAIGGTVLSVLPHILDLFTVPFEGPISVLVSWVYTAVILFISYNIIAGVGDLEETVDMDLGYENLNLVWKIQAVSTIAGALLSYVPIGLFHTIVLILSIIGLGMHIAFLVLFFKARTRYQSTLSYSA